MLIAVDLAAPVATVACTALFLALVQPMLTWLNRRPR